MQDTGFLTLDPLIQPSPITLFISRSGIHILSPSFSTNHAQCQVESLTKLIHSIVTPIRNVYASTAE